MERAMKAEQAEQMELFPRKDFQTIITGDCLTQMRLREANSVDCVVTDPPYGLHFMGKDWDSFKSGKPGSYSSAKYEKDHTTQDSAAKCAGTYDERRNDEFQTFMSEFGKEALRIVKPGGHMLMFGAPRRYHRQACGLEDAGWEIRDCIMWVFGSGFPKSHNFGKKMGGDWEGYGTALKPAYEPILVCMKPLEGTYVENAEKWGVAGINVDACRVGTEDTRSRCSMTALGQSSGWNSHENKEVIGGSACGRWPANIIFDEEAGQALDEMSGMSKSSVYDNSGANTVGFHHCLGRGHKQKNRADIGGYKDSGGASRFFYCPKASSRERNEGLEGLKNIHPTVKPLSLLEYLIKLVMPPKDGMLLDPFAGSGSTLVAAKRLGVNAIGIELSADYAEIARARIERA